MQTDKEIMYVVGYSAGQYEDSYDDNVFITNSEEKAKKWCEKFDRIAKSRLEYACKMELEMDDDYFDREHNAFMHVFWNWDRPSAKYEKIEVR